MWTSPRDRQRAAAEALLRKHTLTPTQERQKEIRAEAFAAGYNQAISRFLPSIARELHDSGHYARERVDAFEQWDWARRVDEAQAKGAGPA